MVSYDNYEKKREIKTVIRRLIEKQYRELNDQPKGIHLILECSKLSEIYFHHLISVVKVVIVEFNTELRMKRNFEKNARTTNQNSDNNYFE